MKFVAPLTEAEHITLQAAAYNGPTARMRQRAQAILCSAQGWRVDQIAQALSAHRTAVSRWFDRWADQGLLGLYDQPRSGRQPIYTAAEQQRAVELVRDHPQQVSQAHVQLIEESGKRSSTRTLKRILKKRLPLEALSPVTEAPARSAGVRAAPPDPDPIASTRSPG